MKNDANQFESISSESNKAKPSVLPSGPGNSSQEISIGGQGNPAIQPSNGSADHLIKTRCLSSRGIEFQGIFYNCQKLQQLRKCAGNCKIDFIYNPSDLSAIYLKDKHHRRLIRIPAVNQEYTRGLSLTNHRKLMKIARAHARSDKVTLSKAKAKIRRIIEKMEKK